MGYRLAPGQGRSVGLRSPRGQNRLRNRRGPAQTLRFWAQRGRSLDQRTVLSEHVQPRPRSFRLHPTGTTTAKRGLSSWRNGAARPLWSADPATTASTHGHPLPRPRNNSLESRRRRGACMEEVLFRRPPARTGRAGFPRASRLASKETAGNVCVLFCCARCLAVRYGYDIGGTGGPRNRADAAGWPICGARERGYAARYVKITAEASGAGMAKGPAATSSLAEIA